MQGKMSKFVGDSEALTSLWIVAVNPDYRRRAGGTIQKPRYILRLKWLITDERAGVSGEAFDRYRRLNDIRFDQQFVRG